MKFIQIKPSNAHGNPNLYEFHVGIEEMKLILGLIRNYIANSPRGIDWLPEARRARNMRNALTKFVEPKSK